MGVLARSDRAPLTDRRTGPVIRRRMAMVTTRPCTDIRIIRIPTIGVLRFTSDSADAGVTGAVSGYNRLGVASASRKPFARPFLYASILRPGVLFASAGTTISEPDLL